MPLHAVHEYDEAAAAERAAFQHLQAGDVGTPDYQVRKLAWVQAIERTEKARRAMLKVWGVDLGLDGTSPG